MSKQYYWEVPIDANVSDILEFLKSETRLIRSKYIPAPTSDGENITVNFHVKIENNTLSICTKIYATPTGKLGPRDWLDDPDGKGNEVIRFEVIRVTDTRSLIKSSYARCCEVMFWERWVRLAIMFGANFASKAKKMLVQAEELEEKGENPENLLVDDVKEQNNMEHEDVFISYSRSDKKYADRLHQAFRENSISVWIDDKIETGTMWQEILENKINNCVIFVVIMSSSASESKWVKIELAYAQKKEKEILPILLEGDCFFSLTGTQFEDVRNKEIPSKTFFIRIKKIIEAVRDKSLP